MRRPLAAVALVLALVGLVLPSSYLPSGGSAAAMGKEDACPAKLGPLRLSSSGEGEDGSAYGEFRCFYRSEDWNKQTTIRASWVSKTDPAATLNLESTYCERTDEDYLGSGQHGDETRNGLVFPLAGKRFILATYLGTNDGPSVDQIKKVARKVALSYASLAATCPGAPDEGSLTEADLDPDAALGITETTVILSGIDAEDVPAIGTRMALPQDDQHALVVGGADGVVIREEFIGTSGVVKEVGLVIVDEDGKRHVLVTLEVTPPDRADADGLSADEVGTADGADGDHGAAAEPADGDLGAGVTDTSPDADDTSTGSGSGSPDTDDGAVPAGDQATDAVTAGQPRDETDSAVAAGGTGTPDEDSVEQEAPAAGAAPAKPPATDGLPKLNGKATKALQKVASRIEDLGRQIDKNGSGEKRIPRKVIEGLVALRPGLVSKLRLGSGTIIVTTSVGDINVTPVVGHESGLIEVRLSKFAWLRNHVTVRHLVSALNSGISQRPGARFRMISVTPDGIVVQAEGPSSG